MSRHSSILHQVWVLACILSLVAARNEAVSLISSQQRQLAEPARSGEIRARLHQGLRHFLRSIEFVDVWKHEQEQTEVAHVQRRSPDNTTFLIANTEEVAAQYGCDPQPWTWTFSDAARNGDATVTQNASDSILSSAATNANSSNLYPDGSISSGIGLALHEMAANIVSSSDPASSNQLQSLDAPSDPNAGQPVSRRNEPRSSSGAKAYGGEGDPVLSSDAVSPLRRKLDNTRPRAQQLYDEESEAEAFTPPLDRGLKERRDNGQNYAVAPDMNTLNWLDSNLNLYQGKVSVGQNNLRLASDPLAAPGTGSPDTILSVFYPEGSYAPSKSDPLGGASFYSQAFLGSSNSVQQHNASDSDQAHFRATLVLQYSVAFPSDFNFVKGGKLPGLYSSVGLPSDGGNGITAGQLDANTDGCSGGARDGVGESCWSARIMWRQGGAGEVYAYFPTNKSGDYDPCRTRASTMICNDAYGTSIGRASFSFVPGQYTNLTLVVVLNSSPVLANGELSLWVNGQQVINEPNLLWRTGTVGVRATGRGGGSGGEAFRELKAKLEQENTTASIGKRDNTTDSTDQTGAQWVDKIFFSTFFGGSTSDYAAAKDEETYFKNFALYSGTRWSSSPGINAAGSASAAGRRIPGPVSSLSASITLVVALCAAKFVL
ncbi:hypothetical protein OC846_003472 [Tilletia horrida]|uniref:Polysaccharide lyase 14 domain-containing protein n=1 Tax=Tilletia horrida TaxID=155126 RepID=A0AAN6GS58_9BASI|nr:hypothetical protein OC846_003472 [Tilletia horrida]KAK0566010.1 hypothetical protein OC861_003445 [Tilletia horrida]